MTADEEATLARLELDRTVRTLDRVHATLDRVLHERDAQAAARLRSDALLMLATQAIEHLQSGHQDLAKPAVRRFYAALTENVSREAAFKT